MNPAEESTKMGCYPTVSWLRIGLPQPIRPHQIFSHVVAIFQLIDHLRFKVLIAESNNLEYN